MSIANIIFIVLSVGCIFGAYQLYCLTTDKGGKWMTRRIMRTVHRLSDSLLAMNRRTAAERQDWVGQMNLYYFIFTVIACLVAVYFGEIHVCIPLITAFALTRESNAKLLQLVEVDVVAIEENTKNIKRDIMEGCRNLDLSNISSNIDRL